MDNLLTWKDRNPLYYRIKQVDPIWRIKARARARRWRMLHKDRILNYRKATMDQYRLYMREYMRRYRAASRIKGGKLKEA
jgi:hypothetical protein